MFGPCSRRVAAGAFVIAWCGFALAGCSGGGSSPTGSKSDGVDVKAACRALGELPGAGAALDGVDPADPGASLAALQKAVDAYSAALQRFELVAPVSLRAQAEAVRTAVVARRFTEAATKRRALDTWARTHCS